MYLFNMSRLIYLSLIKKLITQIFFQNENLKLKKIIKTEKP